MHMPLFDLYSAPEKHCPVCENTYTCPVAVYVICGDVRYTITGKNVIEVESHLPSTGARGVIICREYVCEGDGHRWREVEQFHKGNTLYGTVILPGCIGPMGVMWRD